MTESMDRRKFLKFTGAGLAIATGLPRNVSAEQQNEKFLIIKSIAREMNIITTEEEMLELLYKPENEKPLIIDVRHSADYDISNPQAVVFPQSDNVLKMLINVDPTVNISFMKGGADPEFNTEVNFQLSTQGSQPMLVEDTKKIITKRLLRKGQNPNRPIIVVCEEGIRSAYAAAILKRYYGFSNVKSLDNGIRNIKNSKLKTALLGTERRVSQLN